MKSRLVVALFVAVSTPALADIEITYDAKGRPITVDGVAFYYSNPTDTFASHLWTSDTSGWISIKPVSKALLICKDKEEKVKEKCSGGGTFVADGPFAGAGIGFGVASPGEITHYTDAFIGFSVPGQARYGQINVEGGGRNPAFDGLAWYYNQQQSLLQTRCAQMSAGYGAVCVALAASGIPYAREAGAACGVGVVMMTQNCLNGN